MNQTHTPLGISRKLLTSGDLQDFHYRTSFNSSQNLWFEFLLYVYETKTVACLEYRILYIFWKSSLNRTS